MHSCDNLHIKWYQRDFLLFYSTLLDLFFLKRLEKTRNCSSRIFTIKKKNSDRFHLALMFPTCSRNATKDLGNVFKHVYVKWREVQVKWIGLRLFVFVFQENTNNAKLSIPRKQNTMIINTLSDSSSKSNIYARQNMIQSKKLILCIISARGCARTTNTRTLRPGDQ